MTKTNPTITGINKERAEKNTDIAFSMVDKIGLPKPPVVAVEPTLAMAVPACTIPALPPPTITPNTHFKEGIPSKKSVKNEEAKAVPAIIESGVVKESKK